MRPIPVEFHLWKLAIHTYGIGLAVTFWFAFRYFESRLRRHGYPWRWLTGVFVWVVVASIVGARVMHVLANWGSYFGHGADPLQVFAVWNGGLSSFGGLLGGVPTGVILARRRCPSLPTITALDLVAPVLVCAWGVGRLLGPQLMVNGGGPPTTAWFGMQYANGSGGYTPKEIPVPIFQALECFTIFAILVLLERRYRDRPTGFVLSVGMILWGIERFAEEHVWLAHQGGSNFGNDLVQGAGLVLAAAGVVVMIAVLRSGQRHGAEAVEVRHADDGLPPPAHDDVGAPSEDAHHGLALAGAALGGPQDAPDPPPSGSRPDPGAPA